MRPAPARVDTVGVTTDASSPLLNVVRFAAGAVYVLIAAAFAALLGVLTLTGYDDPSAMTWTISLAVVAGISAMFCVPAAAFIGVRPFTLTLITSVLALLLGALLIAAITLAAADFR